MNGKCENCQKEPAERAMNHMGDIHFLCEKCYEKIKYPIRAN